VKVAAHGVAVGLVFADQVRVRECVGDEVVIGEEPDPARSLDSDCFLK